MKDLKQKIVKLIQEKCCCRTDIGEESFKIADQLLSLFNQHIEEGLPKEKEVPSDTQNWDFMDYKVYGEARGFNTCLQEVKNNLIIK